MRRDADGLTGKQREIIDKLVDDWGKTKPVKRWCKAQGIPRASYYRATRDQRGQAYLVSRLMQRGIEIIFAKAIEGDPKAMKLLMKHTGVW